MKTLYTSMAWFDDGEIAGQDPSENLDDVLDVLFDYDPVRVMVFRNDFDVETGAHETTRDITEDALLQRAKMLIARGDQDVVKECPHLSRVAA